MKTGPKYKVCRRLGSDVYEKCQRQKFTLAESRKGKQRGGKRRRALSDYGKQLLEKQRVRVTYGISERQFSRYVRYADQAGDDPATTLLQQLELRLDNVVFRLGLAPTRRAARQLASHGHFTVNGTRVTIPSYQLRSADTISIRAGSTAAAPFANLDEQLKDTVLPAWLSFDPKQKTAEITGVPNPENTEIQLDLTSVIEFYSR